MPPKEKKRERKYIPDVKNAKTLREQKVVMDKRMHRFQ